MAWQPLVYEPFKLLVPVAVKGRDWRKILESQPFLRYEKSSFGGRLVTRFLRDNGVQVQESMELDEIAGLMNLVSQGLGVALVPMAEAYLPLPELVRAISLGEKTFYREIGILRRSSHLQQSTLHTLETSLRDSLSPDPLNS